VLQQVSATVLHGYGFAQSVSVVHAAPGQPHEQLLVSRQPYWHVVLGFRATVSVGMAVDAACSEDVCDAGEVELEGILVETGVVLTLICVMERVDIGWMVVEQVLVDDDDDDCACEFDKSDIPAESIIFVVVDVEVKACERIEPRDEVEVEVEVELNTELALLETAAE